MKKWLVGFTGAVALALLLACYNMIVYNRREGISIHVVSKEEEEEEVTKDIMQETAKKRNAETNPNPPVILPLEEHQDFSERLLREKGETKVNVKVSGITNVNSRWSIDSESVFLSHKIIESIDIWTLSLSIKECDIDLPSLFTVHVTSERNSEKHKCALKDSFYPGGYANDTIKLAKGISKNMFGNDGCRYYNGSIDIYDLAIYKVEVVRNFGAAGATFTKQQVDMLLTFNKENERDSVEGRKMWSDLYNKSQGITSWVNTDFSNFEIGSFLVSIGANNILTATNSNYNEEDLNEKKSSQKLPYCHEVDHIMPGGRWRGGCWLAPNCILANHSIELASNMMRGLRVRIIGDSNFQRLASVAVPFTCGTNVSIFDFHGNGNNCPPYSTVNVPFAFVWRFYRAKEVDGITPYLLEENHNICTNSGSEPKLFDVNKYNVSIFLPGFWQVASFRSGYPQMVASKLRNILQKCRSAPAWNASEHLLLLQELSSVNSNPFWLGGWRRLRNGDLEEVNREQASILRNQIDGTISLFDMSLAFPMTSTDPIHFPSPFYKAVMHLQIDRIYHLIGKRVGNINSESIKEKQSFKADDFWFLKIKDA